MNKLADARSDVAFAGKKRQNVALRGIIRCLPIFLGKVYFFKSQKDYFLEGKAIFQPQSSVPLRNFIEARRNIPRRLFVYTGAAPYRAAQGEIQKKTPRWQPRGYDTQFFRPLVQEEEVSSRGSLPVQRLRVNSILPRQLAIG